MSNDVFDQDANSGTSTQTTPQTDQSNEFVGEGKKYSTVEEAMRGLSNGQEHITRLEAENETLRQGMANQEKTAEILKAIQEQGNKTTATETPVVSEDKITEIVQNAISETRTAETSEANQAKVVNALKEQYGDKAAETLASKATELGTTIDQLKLLAQTNPTLCLNALGVVGKSNVQQQAQEPSVNVTGTVNTQQIDLNNTEDLKPYYDKMRKEDRSRYWTSEVQGQIAAAVESGKYKL